MRITGRGWLAVAFALTYSRAKPGVTSAFSSHFNLRFSAPVSPGASWPMPMQSRFFRALWP